MSPKPTPLVPLRQIIAGAAEGQEPVPGFVGQVEGTDYVVTAVLGRTAVLEVPGDRWADRRTTRLGDVLVDEAAVQWRQKPPSASYVAWRGRPRPASGPAAQRAASDYRARVDQERRRSVEAAATRGSARALAAVGRLRPKADSMAGQPRPAEGGATRPDRPALARPHAAPVATTPPPEPVRLLIEQLDQARARIAELEVERERVRAAQRRLIRRARAAMRQEAS